MSSFVSCFDVVSMVVEEANDQFAPLWVLDKSKYNVLEQYCTVIDRMAEEFVGEAFEVDIDDIAMTIAITMYCQDVFIEAKDHPMYVLAQRAIQFGFSASNDGKLKVKFVFPSVWKKAV